MDKVDRGISPAVAAAIVQEYADLKVSKPEPAIFWQFIELERNNVLKLYRPSAKQNVTLRVPTIVVDRKSGEQWTEGETSATYSYEMGDGPFVGRDPRDVVAEAIAWWRQYDRVDIRAAAIASGTA